VAANRHGGGALMTTARRLTRYIRPLIGRDPAEAHRVATPLELFTDLCFVVAVAQASGGLHHEISAGHVTRATIGYAMTFFAIFWAWFNFAWFSSAYDNDDVPYRLLTILQIVGSLMLAAGIPRMITEGRTGIGVAGYVVMRIALVIQWFRVAAGDPPRRRTALRYAFGIMAVQLGWICFLFVPTVLVVPWFLVFVALELCIPPFAESAGQTPWHPHHVAERYGLFFIIMLGECILSTTVAIQAAMDAGASGSGLLRVVIGGVAIVFSLWWLYFSREDADILERQNVARNMRWAFGHYFVFGGTAAVGAGLAIRIDYYTHHAEVSGLTAALSLTVPIAVILVSLYLVHIRPHDPGDRTKIAFAVAVVAVLLASFTPAAEIFAGMVCTVLVGICVRSPTAAVDLSE
jgi:low temperature requirement protein LtrA